MSTEILSTLLQNFSNPERAETASSELNHFFEENGDNSVQFLIEIYQSGNLQISVLIALLNFLDNFYSQIAPETSSQIFQFLLSVLSEEHEEETQEQKYVISSFYNILAKMRINPEYGQIWPEMTPALMEFIQEHFYYGIILFTYIADIFPQNEALGEVLEIAKSQSELEGDVAFAFWHFIVSMSKIEEVSDVLPGIADVLPTLSNDRFIEMIDLIYSLFLVNMPKIEGLAAGVFNAIFSRIVEGEMEDDKRSYILEKYYRFIENNEECRQIYKENMEEILPGLFQFLEDPSGHQDFYNAVVEFILNVFCLEMDENKAPKISGLCKNIIEESDNPYLCSALLGTQLLNPEIIPLILECCSSDEAMVRTNGLNALIKGIESNYLSLIEPNQDQIVSHLFELLAAYNDELIYKAIFLMIRFMEKSEALKDAVKEKIDESPWMVLAAGQLYRFFDASANQEILSRVWEIIKGENSGEVIEEASATLSLLISVFDEIKDICAEMVEESKEASHFINGDFAGVVIKAELSEEEMNEYISYVLSLFPEIVPIPLLGENDSDEFISVNANSCNIKFGIPTTVIDELKNYVEFFHSLCISKDFVLNRPMLDSIIDKTLKLYLNPYNASDDLQYSCLALNSDICCKLEYQPELLIQLLKVMSARTEFSSLEITQLIGSALKTSTLLFENEEMREVTFTTALRISLLLKEHFNYFANNQIIVEESEKDEFFDIITDISSTFFELMQYKGEEIFSVLSSNGLCVHMEEEAPLMVQVMQICFTNMLLLNGVFEDNQEEILQMFCEAAQNTDNTIAKMALECLASQAQRLKNDELTGSVIQLIKQSIDERSINVFSAFAEMLDNLLSEENASAFIEAFLPSYSSAYQSDEVDDFLQHALIVVKGNQELDKKYSGALEKAIEAGNDGEIEEEDEEEIGED